MTGVQTLTVEGEEAGQRLDRWFKRHFPVLTHGRLEKMLRTGQVRVDGRRARANTRLEAGQSVRIPPIEPEARPVPSPVPSISKAEADALRATVLFRDDLLLAINKPPGLAVQGGTGTRRHLDAMLDALRFDAAERPRLVHRLDKDTSGVLLLARNRKAAAQLTSAFRSRAARKLYWAVVVGVPRPRQGRIDRPLAKAPGRQGERMVLDQEDGKRAVSLYRVVEHAGKRAAWLALEPLTGRTHQLRVHAAALGTPILGDGKYGGSGAFLTGSLSRKLHLHARAIRMPRPGGDWLEVTAPLPRHMQATWRFLGFDEGAGGAGFLDPAK